MPYIKQVRREQLDKMIENLTNALAMSGEPINDGDVNYVVTRVIDRCYNKPSYAIMARGIMTLECAKQEFYRRVMAPYENNKIAESGDVYGL